jgi:hypothetical protein
VPAVVVHELGVNQLVGEVEAALTVELIEGVSHEPPRGVTE